VATALLSLIREVHLRAARYARNGYPEALVREYVKTARRLKWQLVQGSHSRVSVRDDCQRCCIAPNSVLTDLRPGRGKPQDGSVRIH
jgi:hypothetical protein